MSISKTIDEIIEASYVHSPHYDGWDIDEEILKTKLTQMIKEGLGSQDWAVKCTCNAPVSKMCICTNEVRNTLRNKQIERFRAMGFDL